MPFPFIILISDPPRVSERVTAAVEEQVKMIVDHGSPNDLHAVESSLDSLPPAHVVSSTPVIPGSRRTRSSSRSCKSLTR